MEIPNVSAPLLVSPVRDAVLFREQLLKSQTIRNRADYEKHHLQLTQFLEFIKSDYKLIEKDVGIPIEKLL